MTRSLADKSKNKTPLGDIQHPKDDKELTAARGGMLNSKKYSDSVER